MASAPGWRTVPFIRKGNQVIKSSSMRLSQFEMLLVSRVVMLNRRERLNLCWHVSERIYERSRTCPCKVGWIEIDMRGIFCISTRGNKIRQDVKERMNMKCGCRWKNEKFMLRKSER